ncbi:ABC transporter permease [Microcella sp.]|uniref:ABC transporter permease n=1 Tax=Microcella sp. TaxID=1913979 RepID=UPI003919C7EC
MNTITKARPPLIVWGAVVAVMLTAPTLVVIPLSFTSQRSFRFPIEGWSLQWYERFFTESRWVGALITSLGVALTAAIIATIVGTLAVIALGRSRIALGPVARATLMLPIVVPGIVVAVGVFGAYLRWGISGSFLGLVLAHTVLSIPFVMIPVTTALRGIPETVERAAAVLGANPLRRFTQVQLPLLAPGLVTGFVFAFVTSLDEVVIAFFLQSPRLRTLPVQMYSSVTVETDPTIAVASSLVLVISTVAILVPRLVANSRTKRLATITKEAAS